MKTLTVQQQRDRHTASAIAGVNLELKLRSIIGNPTREGIQEFQQLVQYAPAETKQRLLSKLAFAVLLLCLATSANASMLLTEVYTTWPAASGEFSVGTSPSHELTVPVDSNYTQFDFSSASTAGLTADLTNGVEDMLTFSFDSQSFSRPEDFFRTSGLDDPRHFSAIPWLSTVDYHSMRLDGYQVTTDRAGSLIIFDVYGGVREPPTIVSVILGLVCWVLFTSPTVTALKWSAGIPPWSDYEHQ